ncbi:hypothetical protein AAFF_G00016700 [Aldrovandia affinis]|uniref:Uncharacterized protein n=1 Tax=Aldrovandia affinis TaxID=143900 RepID=A0AAD7S615_9TELE|nr:hypothetical protein AAFF_G00016700 [Aldrovandia affinis]
MHYNEIVNVMEAPVPSFVKINSRHLWFTVLGVRTSPLLNSGTVHNGRLPQHFRSNLCLGATTLAFTETLECV